MRTLLIATVIVFGSIVFSCNKNTEEIPDPCAGCTFPSQCIDGRCVDPCDLVDCGDLDCDNGNCICPTGFQGADCDEEKIPSSVVVTEIRILDFPPKREDGTDWDAGQNDGTGSEPDIYPWPENDYANGVNPYRGLAKVDASNDSVYAFDLQNIQPWTIKINDPEEITGFGIWDRDEFLDQDEYFFDPMGFLPYEPGRPGFPKSDTIMVENTVRGSKALLVIQYRF